MARTVAVVTTSRADYSHLSWVLRDLRDDPQIDLRLIAIGAHLTEEFGRAVDQIELDGLSVDERVECLISSDSDIGMAKTIGVATLGLTEVLGRMRPDLLLLIADRYELLAPASVALALRIPIAHIEGGEVSEGAIDDAVRNALTKMSHLHFVPTRSAERRVLAMGEERWRVHRVGAPSIDYLHRGELPDRASLERQLGVTVNCDAVLAVYHPVTIARDTLRETEALFSALDGIEQQCLFCLPNSDSGSRRLMARARRFCESRSDARLFVNLNPRVYWSLLRHVSVMIGNSSSGIMETPSLELPTINIGIRQQGRERAANIIDTGAEVEAILAALSRARAPEFRRALAGMESPYGDGTASRRIVRVLAEAPLGERLRLKTASALPDDTERSTAP